VGDGASHPRIPTLEPGVDSAHEVATRESSGGLASSDTDEMSDSFLRAAQIRSSDSPSPPAAAELIASLGADELQTIALSVDDPAIVCRMAAVCRLWRATAHSEPVWAALAAAYWVGPLARPPTGSARDAVVGIESALRDVASGRRRLAILLEQNGEIHVPLASCRWSCALDASPFRILSVFGGPRPFCSVSLLSNASDVGASAVAEAAVLERDKDEFLGLLEPVPYSEGKLGRPLLELHPGRVHEEEDFDEADAMMNWEAGGSPGPGLFLSCHTNHRDKGRHQSFSRPSGLCHICHWVTYNCTRHWVLARRLSELASTRGTC